MKYCRCNYEKTDLIEIDFKSEERVAGNEVRRYSEDDFMPYWREIPPLPGEKNWGDGKYDIIEEIMMKPLENNK